MRVIDAKHYLIDISVDLEGAEDSYPFNLPVIKNLDKLTFHPKVTFITGENGSGKSTLLEAIAVAMGFNAEGGSKNFNFATRPSHSKLHERIRATKGLQLAKDGFFLRAESFYNVATEVERLEMKYGVKSLHEQSHGESFISLVEDRFRKEGLYILDEPEAALSPTNQLKFIALIHRLAKQKCQFIIATHSPIILGYPDADIYVVNSDSIEKTEYEQTGHYQITKYFLMNRARMLDDLLQND